MHFSPEKTGVRLELRRFGVLHRIATIGKPVYDDIVRKLKFIAHMKLNLSNIPQDGQYTFAVETRSVNVRVATIPSRFGEAVTLRLLDPQRGIVPLAQLGFPKEIADELKRIVELPNGLLLITGPTGSGKTTTLYALLQSIVGHERHIVTLEDPVEYELPGIVQSQVDPDHDYDFARGLRSILRHDPDVILVGEIRDLETAQTAVDAALTGHLVLSTLHTNGAAEAIPRLLSMGVSSYTLAPSLRGILAQRLVRVLASDCKGKKCDPSDPKTFTGTCALAELVTMNQDMRALTERGASQEEIVEAAKKNGFQSMAQWGKTYVEQGITLQSEVDRVCS